MKTVLLSTFTIMLLGWTSICVSQEFVWAPAFPVGEQIPAIDAPDQTGERKTLADLSGEKGLVLVLSRSFDWCPYCIAQLQQLVDVAEDFAALGFTVATMTYDSEQILQDAQSDHDVHFPLLRDENARHILALGILNTDYQPGSRAYGIPYPGIFVLTPNGNILAKFAEEDYRDRPDFQYLLEAVKQF
jgi:peroxiredoxin